MLVLQVAAMMTMGASAVIASDVGSVSTRFYDARRKPQSGAA